MSAEHLDEEAIFSAALQKKTPAERAAYLNEVCGDDAVLRQNVEELLQLQPEADQSLRSEPRAASPARCAGRDLPWALLEASLRDDGG